MPPYGTYTPSGPWVPTLPASPKYTLPPLNPLPVPYAPHTPCWPPESTYTTATKTLHPITLSPTPLPPQHPTPPDGLQCPLTSLHPLVASQCPYSPCWLHDTPYPTTEI